VRLLTASAAFAAALIGGAACGQSMNIDFDQAGGIAATAPLPGYAGAAGQTGRWNAVDANSNGPVALTGLAWEPTTAVYRRVGGGGAYSQDNPNSTGEAHYLFDDIIDVGPVGAVATIRLEGMIPGLYEVFTYAIAPDSAAGRTSVFVPGSSSPNPQVIGGVMPAGEPVLGITHARHLATVAADGILAVQATTTAGFGSLNGMQVRFIAPARLYVNADAAPGGDGTSWSKALRELHVASDIARAYPTVIREIWVTSGPFSTQFPPLTGRASSFHFTTPASIYGGFLGTETTLAERPNRIYTSLSGAGVGGGGLNADWVVNFAPVGALFDGQLPVLDGFGIIFGGNNDGVDGGGVRMSGGVLRNCSISRNRGIDGGGVRMSGFSFMADCFVHSNQAVRGGGVYVTGNNALITNCRIAGNTAWANGGGVYLTGFTPIQHSVVYLNHAAAGGGIAGAGPTVSPALTNCTIAHNSAEAFGGLYFVDTDGAPGGPALFNTIVWGNADTDPVTGTRRANIEYSAWPLGIGASYCIIEGFAGGPPFVGTIVADPLFAAPAVVGGMLTGSEDYTPLPGSPAIDSADSNRLRSDEFDIDRDGDRLELLPWDVRRNPRLVDDPAIADTGAGFVGTLDRGAVERQPEPFCPADFNQDGGIDGADVDAFYAAWENGLPQADVNQDGGIDGADVDTFFAAWEAGGCP